MAAKNFKQAWEWVNVAIKAEAPPAHRILLADPDPEILRLNTEALSNAGYDVDFAADGAGAWEAIQLAKYDLLVTEYALPKISGLELLANIRIARYELPVLMVAGAPPEKKLRLPPWLPVGAMLLKPYQTGELLAVVRNILLAKDLATDLARSQPDWQYQLPADDLRF